jgi:cell division protein FtsB
MPLPLIPLVVAGAVAASTAIAGKKGYDSYQNIKETKDIAESTEKRYKAAFQAFEQTRKQTNEHFEQYGREKLEILNGSMADFVTEFKKLKHVDFSNHTAIDSLDKVKDIDLFMREVEKQTIQAAQIMSSGVSAIAGGGLAAMGAMGAATTFGLASTGTAIASLSGVAATNATLAFFGGGSLAAGGLGMAGGMVVLGGIALAPALALGSIIFASSTEKKLEQMKKQKAEVDVEIAKLHSAQAIMKEIGNYTMKVHELAKNVDELLAKYVGILTQVIEGRGTDYRSFHLHEKELTKHTYELVVVMKHLLDTPIIDEAGNISTALEETIQITQQHVAKL